MNWVPANQEKNLNSAIFQNYVHRSGRTARAQKEGMTILFVEPKEMPQFKRMCHTLGKSNQTVFLQIVGT